MYAKQDFLAKLLNEFEATIFNRSDFSFDIEDSTAHNTLYSCSGETEREYEIDGNVAVATIRAEGYEMIENATYEHDEQGEMNITLTMEKVEIYEDGEDLVDTLDEQDLADFSIKLKNLY